MASKHTKGYMMKKIIIPTIATLLLVTNASAFDGNKEGFMLGIGAGVSSVKTTYTGGNSRDTSFATSLKLGYGFNEQLAVYLASESGVYKYNGKGETADTSLIGIGLDYYIDQNSPFYVTGMVGLGSVNKLKKAKVQTGYGFLIGAGYEISDHITLQADYMKINTDDKLNADTDSIRFTARYTWY